MIQECNSNVGSLNLQNISIVSNTDDRGQMLQLQHLQQNGITIELQQQHEHNVQLQQQLYLTQQQQLVTSQQPILYYCNNNETINNNNYNSNNLQNGQLCIGAITSFENMEKNSKKEAAVKESLNLSDCSTVEDKDGDGCILPVDDTFSYLQGLNSDNLMQFSQQSAIQELIKEQMDVKPNLNVLPTFEEHDIGGYKFQLDVSTTRKGKVNWIHSSILNKVYIRMDDILSIDAVYTPKMPIQQLRIRALMCFVKEVSEPVLRCQNHISKDTEQHPKRRLSLLRCENPHAEYCGIADGKSINDRYSILIPLASNVVPKGENSVKQTIAFRFTCQNSCVGRKETSIIFLLEGMNGEILSQRVLDVKVCSCPKRDKQMDERNLSAGKRKMQEDLYPRKVKKAKEEHIPVGASLLKRENSSSSDLEDNDKHYSIKHEPNGTFRLTMICSTKESLLSTVKTNLHDAHYTTYSHESTQVNRLSKHIRRLKRLYDKALSF